MLNVVGFEALALASKTPSIAADVPQTRPSVRHRYAGEIFVAAAILPIDPAQVRQETAASGGMEH